MLRQAWDNDWMEMQQQLCANGHATWKIKQQGKKMKIFLASELQSRRGRVGRGEYLMRIFAEGGAAAGVDARVLGVPFPCFPATVSARFSIGASGFRYVTGVPAVASPCRKHTTPSAWETELRNLPLRNGLSFCCLCVLQQNSVNVFFLSYFLKAGSFFFLT